MKIALLSHDASGAINPVVYDTLLRFLPLVASTAEADVVVVPVSNQDGYTFNPALLKIRKPICVMDYTEYGWDAGDKPNVLGTGAFRDFGFLNTPEWEKLDTWACVMPAALHFKRELFQRDVNPRRMPIEFPCRIPAPPIQTKVEFEARPIEVFHYWGLSNPVRQKYHGQIFQKAHEFGIHVVDMWDQDEHFERRTWATIHAPWYNRKPIEEVMRWNFRSKLSVSLPGAGNKCFRHSESPVGSIMALTENGLSWSYPWHHLINCFRMNIKQDSLWMEFLSPSREISYSIYLASQDNIDRYRSERYVREYVLPAIAARL